MRVADQWNYICVLVDLFNREIIGYGAEKNKDAKSDDNKRKEESLYDDENLTDSNLLKILIDEILTPTDEYTEMFSEVKAVIMAYGEKRNLSQNNILTYNLGGG